MRNPRLVCFGLLAAACCMATAHDAKADFASDATAIAEQLIEDNIATQVVPNGASKFPIACDLLPASMYALQAKRYNGFPGVIRKELADGAGFISYLAIQSQTSTPANPADLSKLGIPKLYPQTVAVLRGIPGLGALKGIDIREANALCAFTTGAADVPTPKGTVYAAPTRSVASTVMQACAKTQGAARAEMACAIGFAVRDAANGDDKLLSGDAQRALVAIAAQAVLLKPPAGSTLSLDGAISIVNQALASKALLPLDAKQTNLAPAVLLQLTNEIATLSSSSSGTVDQVIATVTAFGGRAVSSIPDLKDSQDQLALASVGTLATRTYAVVRDLQAKDYGGAAGDAFDAVEDTLCPKDANLKAALPLDDQKLCDDALNKPVRAFLRATTVYAIDAATAGSVGTAASSDFRAAAVDLVEAAGGSGIRRRTFDSKSRRNSGVLFPNLSLRAALRPGFAGSTTPGTTSSALVVYPSMDWPSFRGKIYPGRRVESPLWLGVNLSVLDVLGPFYELAARNRLLGNDPNVAVATIAALFVPRADVEFAVPQLTEHLTIGLGGAFRLVRADQLVTLGGSLTTMGYCVVGQSGGCPFGNSSFNSNNVEGSLFVKYIP